MMKTVVITAAGGKVGSSLSAALLSERIHLVLLDSMPEPHLSGLMSRLMIERQLQQLPMHAKVTIKGDVDFHNLDEMTTLFYQMKPDIVVNYATLPHWHRHGVKARFPNICRAGQGAFVAVEAITPMLIGQALHLAGVKPHFVIGNAPDLTVPLLHASHQWKPLVKPVFGIGSIGLFKYAMLTELKRNTYFHRAPLNIDLVAHHIHWEATRWPDTQQNVPFLLRIKFDEQDITRSVGDARTFLQQAVINNYEPGSGFTNTSGLLARKAVSALLNERILTRIHLPAPNGMGIGMPCLVSSHGVETDLPKDWSAEMVQSAAVAAQKADGIEQILAGGGVKFTLLARKTLKDTIGFKLPEELAPAEFARIAQEQIACF